MRADNLELLLEHGKNAWLGVNQQLERDVAQYAADIDAVKENINRLNGMRKTRQKRAVAEISDADREWYTLCGKNVEIQQQVALMEREVKRQRKTLGE